MAHLQETESLECCICGNTVCRESYDHKHLTKSQLYGLLQNSSALHPSLSDIYSRVGNYYLTVASRMLQMLRQDERQVVQALRKLEFPFLQKEKVSMKLLCEVSNGDFSSLPTRKLIPLLQALSRPHQNPPNYLQVSAAQLLLIQQTAPQCIQPKLNTLSQALLYPLLKSEQERNLCLHKTVSIRKLRHLEEVAANEENSFVLQGVRCSENSKEIMLNNKGITDADLFQPIAKMKHFPNLISLELRNNKITDASCRLIAVSLKNLQRLDIRGNRLQDNAFTIIARRLINLRELYVCDNELSDQAIQAIVQSIKTLTLIWLQNNKVTYRGAQRIIHHQNMKAIGLIGNNITEQEAEKLRNRFTLGYISI